MEELKVTYDKNGFLIVPDAKIDKDALRNINVSLSRIIDESNKNFPYLNFSNYGDEQKLQRVTQIHTINKVFNIIRDSEIGVIASKITSSKVIRIWGSQLYIKPIMNSGNANVGIHSEFNEMPFFAKGVLTVWIPMNNVSSNNGTLKYIKSSHLWSDDFNCEAANTDVESKKNQINDRLNQSYDEVTVTLDIGGVSFHHNKLLHYSDKNTGDFNRCAIAVGLMTDDLLLDDKFNDFGYSKIIDDLNYCPIIYSD